MKEHEAFYTIYYSIIYYYIIKYSAGFEIVVAIGDSVNPLFITMWSYSSLIITRFHICRLKQEM